MQALCGEYGRNHPKGGLMNATQEIVKYVLEQASGVVIALMLIWRIKTKLDGLTSAIMHLSDAKASK